MYFSMGSNLKKYWTVLRISWMNGFAYPISFWMWRLRQMISIVIAISMWEAIFSSTERIASYDKAQMLSYIFVSSIVSFIVLSSRTIEVQNVIHSGDLSLYLMKPLNFFFYWFTRDIADKFQNIVFAIGELAFLFVVFQPNLIIPQHWMTVLFSLTAVFGGLLLYFFINLIFSFFVFWIPDAWAPRFLFFIIVFFTAGSSFPLDIFPKPLTDFFMQTPFPFLLYFQTKLWLGQLNLVEMWSGFFMLSFWICMTAGIAYALWKKGVYGYGSEGR